MTELPTRPEKLRKFVDDFFDGKQKHLAGAYELSPSQVSAWLSPKNEKSEVPVYMERIIDLTRKVEQLSSEIQTMRAASVVKMKASYAIVQFPDMVSPGAVLCRGIADLETAKNLEDVLHRGLSDSSKSNSKEI
jgi:hypothetical protein